MGTLPPEAQKQKARGAVEFRSPGGMIEFFPAAGGFDPSGAGFIHSPIENDSQVPMPPLPKCPDLLLSHPFLLQFFVMCLLSAASILMLTDLQTMSIAEEGLSTFLSSVGEQVSGGTPVQSLFASDPLRTFGTDLAIFLIGCGLLLVLKKEHWIRFFFLGYCLIWLLILAANTALMVVSLWSPAGRAAWYLLDAAMVWSFNILLSGVIFWLLDMEDQVIARKDSGHRTQFIFPQSLLANPAWKDWLPGIFEYLFVAFTIAITFGPSDTLIVSRRAKFFFENSEKPGLGFYLSTSNEKYGWIRGVFSRATVCKCCGIRRQAGRD
jgi:hypothetical protein